MKRDGSNNEQRFSKETKKPQLMEKPIEPNFGLSGALARDRRTGNIVQSVSTSTQNTLLVSKYAPPIDSCDPEGDWRLYIFKQEEVIETLYLHRKSFFTFGRDADLVDIRIDHPSCSKEHAAIQYRKRNKKTRLYLIDLESTNGTFLNGEKIDPAQYIEIRDGDVVKFGESSRDYVFKTPKSLSDIKKKEEE